MLLATLIASCLATTPPMQETPPKKRFTYLSTGVLLTGPIDIDALRRSLSPDVFIGHRTFLSSKHAIDFGGGGGYLHAFERPYIYCQASYLYYPKKYNKVYLGVGLTWINIYKIDIRPFMYIPDIPFTYGYQYKTKRPSFVQIQVTPYLTATIQYGIGF